MAYIYIEFGGSGPARRPVRVSRTRATPRPTAHSGRRFPGHVGLTMLPIFAYFFAALYYIASLLVTYFLG